MTYPFAHLLNRVIAVCSAKVVFTQENSFGFAMLEPHHRVLPVANVVAEADVKDFISEVEAVEVEPECVNYSIAFINHDQYGWCVTFPGFAMPPSMSVPCLDGFVVGLDVKGTDTGIRFAGRHSASPYYTVTVSFAGFVPAFSSAYIVEDFAFDCDVEFEVFPGVCSEIFLFERLAGNVPFAFEPVGSLLWIIDACQEDMLAFVKLIQSG